MTVWPIQDPSTGKSNLNMQVGVVHALSLSSFIKINKTVPGLLEVRSDLLAFVSCSFLPPPFLT